VNLSRKQQDFLQKQEVFDRKYIFFAFHYNVYLKLLSKHDELIDTSRASKRYVGIHAKYLSISYFNQTQIFWTDFSKSNHKIFHESERERIDGRRNDRQTHKNNEDTSRYLLPYERAQQRNTLVKIEREVCREHTWINNLKEGDDRTIEKRVHSEKYLVDEYHSFRERKANIYRTIK
jgi:hypothetical protein